jgi:hypothetical protein
MPVTKRPLTAIQLGVFATVLAVATPVADAEPFSGTVADVETLEPIAGATVTIDDGDEATPIVDAPTVTTDEAGRFSFDDVPPGPVSLIVTAEGYDQSDLSAEVPEGGTNDTLVVLTRIGFTSETIEMIAKAPIEIVAPGQTELSREELVKMPGTRGDALQVVRTLPGVANSDSAGPGFLVIRGGAPEDSIFLLDGVQIPLVYHFFGLQSILPSEFIDDIEFMPGGFGVEQGRATAGIVHIKTRPSRSKEWTGFAELSFINAAGYIEGPVWKEKDVRLSMAFRRSVVDFLLPAVIPEESTVSFTTAPQYYDGQLRLDYDPAEGHSLALMGLVSYDLLELLADEGFTNDPAAAGGFTNETQFYRIMPSWKYRSLTFDNTAQVSVGGGEFIVEVGNDRFLGGTINEIVARNDAEWRASQRVSARAGFDLYHASGDFRARFPLPPQEGVPGDPNFTTDPLVEYDDPWSDTRLAGYVASDIRPTKELEITPGVRLDHYAHIGQSTVSPRLNVAYDINEKITARAGLGSYSRPLDQAEALNDDLEPELATQYVLGGEYRHSDTLSAVTTLFYTDRRQLVVQDPNLIEMSAEEAFVNRGWGQSYGLEVMLRARTDDFFGWIAYTLSRGTRVDGPETDERLFDFDQPHNFIAVGSYKWGKWTFGGRFQYTSGEPDTPVVGSIFLSDLNTYIPIFGELNSERFEAAHQIDLRVDRFFEFDSWKLSVYLDITNVYAHARVLGHDYGYDYAEQEDFTTLPILPALGVRGSF